MNSQSLKLFSQFFETGKIRRTVISAIKIATPVSEERAPHLIRTPLIRSNLYALILPNRLQIRGDVVA
jgi:hypothetical protein